MQREGFAPDKKFLLLFKTCLLYLVIIIILFNFLLHKYTNKSWEISKKNFPIFSQWKSPVHKGFGKLGNLKLKNFPIFSQIFIYQFGLNLFLIASGLIDPFKIFSEINLYCFSLLTFFFPSILQICFSSSPL